MFFRTLIKLSKQLKLSKQHFKKLYPVYLTITSDNPNYKHSTQEGSFNMAMMLTMLRFTLIIPFSICFFISAKWAMPIAFFIFIIAAITDYFDGVAARALNQTSVLGAALDPLADKMLTGAALLLLIYNDTLIGYHVFGALIILSREFLVTGLREAVALQGGSLAVTKIAKWKTTFQLIALAGLLAIAPQSLFGPSLLPFVMAIFWVSVVLTFWTGIDYAIKAYKFLGAR